MGCNTGMISEIHAKADQHCQAERLFIWQYGMICCKSLLILMKSCHFATDCVAAAGGHYRQLTFRPITEICKVSFVIFNP